MSLWPVPSVVLKPGPSKVNICLHNSLTKEVVIGKKTAMGEMVAANAIPVMLA